jgi:hypothetical protein
MGKGSSVVNNELMKVTMHNYYLDLKDDIKCRTYIYKNSLIYHIQIPSRKSEKIMYDVVWEFDTKDINDPQIISVANLPAKVFSNCPSFTFTYAKIFYDRKILCGWTLKKFDKTVLKKAPDVRNPHKIISYERSLYIAARWIMDVGRNRVGYVKTTSRKLNGYQLLLRLLKSQSTIEQLHDVHVTKVEQAQNRDEKRKEATKKSMEKTEKLQKERRTTALTSKTQVLSKTKKGKKVRKI